MSANTNPLTDAELSTLCDIIERDRRHRNLTASERSNGIALATRLFGAWPPVILPIDALPPSVTIPRPINATMTAYTYAVDNS